MNSSSDFNVIKDYNTETQKNPEISVIVPIYNVDKYLNRCIDSIINQSFKNIEIILIDDGSTDDSPEICDYYANIDSRIKVIHKANGGLADARNTGIRIAKGSFFSFIDSDDFIELSYLEDLYNAAVKNDCDISYCNYAIYKQNKGTIKKIRIRKPFPGITTGEKICKLTIKDFRSRSYAWNKLYKRSLFYNEENIRYPIMNFEDIATTPRLMFFAKKVIILDKCLYYYTKREGSILSHLDLKKMNDYILSLGVLRNFFENHNCYNQYKFEHRWLGFLMWFSMPFNIIKTYFFNDKQMAFFKEITSGTLAGWRAVIYFISKRFIKTDNVIPYMPYKIYTDDEIEEEKKERKEKKAETKIS